LEISLKNLSIRKFQGHVQTFPEICRYSCSRNGEVREFSLLKEFYQIRVFKFKFKVFESVRIECNHCKWTASLPGGFAKRAFKDGLKSHFLIKYAKSRVVTSRLLNFYGSLWRIWIFSLGVVISITMIRYFFEPIVAIEPKESTFVEAMSDSNNGNIIKTSGKVDYTLAFIKELKDRDNSSKAVDTEVYLPLFSKSNGEEFIVIRGGKADVSNVLARSNVTNYDLLRNQDYTVMGQLEPIEHLSNGTLKKFFTEELPQKRNVQPPKYIINAADIKTLPEFYNSISIYYYIFVFLLVTSTATQFYLDKLIVEK
jgi:hypothetical protein